MSSHPYTTDTSPEAHAVQLECLRRMTPQERIGQMCELSEHVQQMTFDAIRRRHPDFSEDEVKLKFIELTYGKELAANVRRWKQERRT